MTSDPRHELLIGYLEDDLPPGERRALERSLREDPALAEELEALRRTDQALYLVAERDWRRSGLPGAAVPLPFADGLPTATVISDEFPTEPATSATWYRRLWRSTWIMPAAASILALVAIGGWYASDQQEKRKHASAPQPVATVIESTAPGWSTGMRLQSREDHLFRNGVVTLSLAGEPNSVIYAGQDAALHFLDRTTIRQNAGSAYYLLRRGDAPYTVTLENGTNLTMNAASFELANDTLSVKDGSITIQVPGTRSRFEVRSGERLELRTGTRTPRPMTPAERSSLGHWTGQFGTPPTAVQETEGSSELLQDFGRTEDGDAVTARRMAAMLPGDATAALFFHLPEKTGAETRTWPVAIASVEDSLWPVVLLSGPDPGGSALLLMDLVSPWLRQPSMRSPMEIAGLRFFELLDRRLPNRPTRSSVRALVSTAGPLAMLIPAEGGDLQVLTSVLNPTSEQSFLQSPLGAELFRDADEPGSISFALDLSRWLEHRLGAPPAEMSALLRVAGIGPQTLLTMDGALEGERLRMSGRLSGLGAGESVGAPGAREALALLPRESAIAAAFAFRDGAELFDTILQSLIEESYAGDRAMAEKQLRALEAHADFSLRSDVMPHLRGTASVGFLPSAGANPNVIVALPITNTSALRPLLERRLLLWEWEPDRRHRVESGAVISWHWHLREDALLVASNADLFRRVQNPLQQESIVQEWRSAEHTSSLYWINPGRWRALNEEQAVTVRPAAHHPQHLQDDKSSEGVLLGIGALHDGTRPVTFLAPGTVTALEDSLAAVGLTVFQQLERRRHVRAMDRNLDMLATKIAEFIEKEGRAPTNLDELSSRGLIPYPVEDILNPQGGMPQFVYDLPSKTWRLWSLGPDGTDQHGIIVWQPARSINDHGDLVRRGALP